MNHIITNWNAGRAGRRDRRGGATILALMVSLLLMALVSGTMALTLADTEMTQDFARNQASFEAADSGVQHGKRRLANALTNWYISPATVPGDVESLADDAESGNTAGNTDLSLLSGSALGFNSLMPRGSTAVTATWPDDTGLHDTRYDLGFDITPTSVDRPDPGDISATHTFHYDYEITARGEAARDAQVNQATRTERGSFDVRVERPSFATYGYFTDSMKNQFNQQLWFYDGEVYDGPTHVNSAPPEGQAAFWGDTVFNGAFTAVQEAFEDSILGGGADPEFNAGSTWGVDPIDVPQNGWSQLRASVGDLDNVDNPTSPSAAELRDLLQLEAGSDPVPQGVYLAPDSNEGAGLLGGVFINGSPSQVQLTQSGSVQTVSITLTASDGGPFDGTHTWEIASNNATGTTSVSMDGGTPVVYNEALNGVVHAEGSIGSLIGNGGSGADIQAATKLTISALDNIVVNDHITYADNPSSNPDATNILGVFSSNGNILLGENAPSNLNLHATVMAASEGKGVGAEGITAGSGYNYNYPNKGNWNLVGGLIEARNQTTGVFYSDGNLTGYTWNFTYDNRFLSGVAPPYFPYVSKFVLQMQGIDPQNWSRKHY